MYWGLYWNLAKRDENCKVLLKFLSIIFCADWEKSSKNTIRRAAVVSCIQQKALSTLQYFTVTFYWRCRNKESILDKCGSVLYLYTYFTWASEGHTPTCGVQSQQWKPRVHRLCWARCLVVAPAKLLTNYWKQFRVGAVEPNRSPNLLDICSFLQVRKYSKNLL